MERARRLRRARALRDNVPYRLEIQSLDNLYAIRAALTEIAQALAAGQLDPRVAGKLLYAIQLVAATNRRIEKMEAVPQSLSRAEQGFAPLIWALTWVHTTTPPASRNSPSLKSNSVSRPASISMS